MDAETTFGGLDDATWDALAGPHFYSTSAWQRYCTAETGTPGLGMVAYDGERPACAVPVRELGGLPPWSRYRWNDRLDEFGLPALPSSGLLVGAPEGFQTHFLHGPGERSDAVVGELVDRLREPAADAGERASVAMFLTTADVRAARRAGVTAPPVLLDADAWIAVPEGGWPEWLESLRSKRAYTVRKEDRAFTEAGYEISHLPLSECWDRLGVAAAATLEKYGHETTPETELVSLERAAELLGDTARVAVCHYGDGEPVGFCIYYRWGDTVFLRWAGFEYDRLAGAGEYFNLLYYTQVKLAPETGVRWLHAGVTAQAAKALRGAELRPLWLLDLSATSALDEAEEAVRQHNRRLYDEYCDDSRTAAALVDETEWREFG